MSASMTILVITVQLIKSRSILRSKGMRMAEQGRLATAPNITIHLPSSICPLGIGEFSPYLFGIGCGAVSHGAAGGLLDTAAHHTASAGHLALASNEHVLKAAEYTANGLATDGGKALEKRCYGETVAIQKRYGDGERPRIRVAYFQPSL